MGKIIISSEMDKGLYGYARYPNIYVNKRIVRYKKLYKKTVTHERIHLAQQRELLVLPFYIWYVLEYFFHYCLTRDAFEAYRRISFEKECYRHEDNPRYLSKRVPYNYILPWKKSLKKTSRRKITWMSRVSSVIRIPSLA